MAKNTVADVVILDSDSDDDDGGGIGMGRSLTSLMDNQQVSNAHAATVAPRETLECRSFWKAGENFVIPSGVTPTAPGYFSDSLSLTLHNYGFGST